jgi:RNA polymerase sigma factor (sigma-70 family)
MKTENVKDYHHFLFPYAYNILGSAEDAKDAVQDVMYNYLSADRQEIENVKGYLVRSVINQSINIRNKKKRVSYGDMWLPEPVATDTADRNTNLQEIVSYSMMILLEKLTPKERAVFILKEAYQYTHEEIASIINGTVEQSRKLLSRAKAKLPAKGEIPEAKPAVSGMLEKYIHAIKGRDMQELESLLSEDISFYADGGNKVSVVAKFATGAHEVAGLIQFVYEKYDKDLAIVPAVINHQPALLYYRGEVLISCQVFGLSGSGDKILQISNVLDPAKLRLMGNSEFIQEYLVETD